MKQQHPSSPREWSRDESGQKREKAFAAYQVDAGMMAVFMRCLPAPRGQEVGAMVIDGSQSVVFEEAGNRLPTRKALLVARLSGTS